MNSVRFRSYVRNWYRGYGRHTLPWRLTTDPYRILVSELMLQQTQVERVVPKYQAFLERFPNVQTLSAVSLREVFSYWQGLGYNRRAKYLWQTAQAVTAAGDFPHDEAALRRLPGIGPYTAAAICCFAYNQPVLLIETNVRSVFIYHFFPGQPVVTDQEILGLVTETLDQENPREWYWALMDYGSYLKKVIDNPSQRSKHYTKQSQFAGSRRQIRGIIMRELGKPEPSSYQELEKLAGGSKHFVSALEALRNEGMIFEREGMYSLETIPHD